MLLINQNPSFQAKIIVISDVYYKQHWQEITAINRVAEQQAGPGPLCGMCQTGTETAMKEEKRIKAIAARVHVFRSDAPRRAERKQASGSIRSKKVENSKG